MSRPRPKSPALEGVVLNGEVMRAEGSKEPRPPTPQAALDDAAAERAATLRFLREFKEMYVAMGTQSPLVGSAPAQVLRALEWLTNSVAYGAHRQDDWRDVARTLAAAMMRRS